MQRDKRYRVWLLIMFLVGQLDGFSQTTVVLPAACNTCPTPAGSITALNCAGTTHTGTLKDATAASGVSSSVPYTGGNGGTYSAFTVSSTGVTGLTASIAAGSFASGAGSLTVSITGTPTGSGTASFALNIGGQTCTLTRTVDALVSWPASYVHCSQPTVVQYITTPTGKVWMDRNLGASRVATSSDDAQAFGSLFQWGRSADGHQCVNRFAGDGVTTSGTTTTRSTTDVPSHGNFIIASSDWRNPINTNLWQGVNGINNPCPTGYRLPTQAEFTSESSSWSNSTNITDGYASIFKFTSAGLRNWGAGDINVGTGIGRYWSSTHTGTYAKALSFGGGPAFYDGSSGSGFSVRCIKN